MKSEMYRLCELSRPVAGGSAVTISWLPVRFAEEGRNVALRNERGEWVEGWRVDSAAPGERDERYINKRPVFGAMDKRNRSRKVGI
jgi:hypothetical protein